MAVPNLQPESIQELLKELQSLQNDGSRPLSRSGSPPEIPQFAESPEISEFQQQMMQNLFKNWGALQPEQQQRPKPHSKPSWHGHSFHPEEIAEIDDSEFENISKVIDLRNNQQNHLLFRFDTKSRTTMMFMEDMFQLEALGIYGTFLVDLRLLSNRRMIPLLEFIQQRGHLIAYDSFEDLSNKDTPEMVRILNTVEYRMYNAIGKRPFVMSHAFNDIYAEKRDDLKDKMKRYLQIKFTEESARSGASVTDFDPLDDATKMKPISEFLDKAQNEILCRQYDCAQEMMDTNSTFYKLCIFNLQCGPSEALDQDLVEKKMTRVDEEENIQMDRAKRMVYDTESLNQILEEQPVSIGTGSLNKTSAVQSRHLTDVGLFWISPILGIVMVILYLMYRALRDARGRKSVHLA